MKKTDRKSSLIKFRITKGEKDKIAKIAKEQNITISEYMHNLLQQNKNTPQKKPKNEKQDVLYHLSRIGNNLNQISYNLNKLYKSKKINNEILKDISEELMYMNLQITTLIEK